MSKLLEGLEVRNLSDYPSDELVTLLLAISYVKSSMKDSEGMVSMLEIWAKRIDMAIEEQRKFKETYR